MSFRVSEFIETKVSNIWTHFLLEVSQFSTTFFFKLKKERRNKKKVLSYSTGYENNSEKFYDRMLFPRTIRRSRMAAIKRNNNGKETRFRRGAVYGANIAWPSSVFRFSTRFIDLFSVNKHPPIDIKRSRVYSLVKIFLLSWLLLF